MPVVNLLPVVAELISVLHIARHHLGLVRLRHVLHIYEVKLTTQLCCCISIQLVPFSK